MVNVAPFHLTDRGEALIRDAFPRVVTALVGVFSVLTAGEQKQLAALCRRLGVAES
jgi:hypothetical protein